MGFSSFFSDDIKARQLKAGAIVYIHCDFTTPPKSKYALVCCTEPLLMMLINSEIPKFIERNHELKKHQVPLQYSDYNFLNWDSFLNCVDAHQAYNYDHLRGLFHTSFQQVYKGTLTAGNARDVLHVVATSMTLSPIHKKKITKSLTDFISTEEE